MKAKKKVASIVKPAATKAATTPRRAPAKAKRVVKAAPRPPSQVAKPVKATKPAAKRKAAPRKTARAKVTVKLPAILLEGDVPSAPLVSGPGEKYALGPTPPVQTFPAGTATLPESYGTRKLFLTARDPHWLYANWDLTREQQSRYNRQSVDGHLILRVYFTPPGGGLAVEIHVHPESRHWFAHVEHAATKYTAELGYYGRARQWTSIAKSGATLTPPETISEEGAVAFATIPVDVPFAVLLDMVKEAAVEHQPLAHAIEELRSQGHADLPKLEPPPPAPAVSPRVSKARTAAPRAATPPPAWTSAQEQALAEIVSFDEVRRVWVGSLEITELIRRQLEHGSAVSSIAAAQFGQPGLGAPGGAITSVSSPFGGEQPAVKGFWFNINAELIIYGATERDAAVTIGGRRIKLRPDGSFSYRFALPDGRYDLPVVAVSADGTDGRAAELKFTRATEIRGEVGTHPQDPNLKPPTPDHV